MPDSGDAEVDSSEALRFLTFRIDKHCYSLRADDVAEVIRVPAMTRVPQSPKALLGIANLRGAVLPIVSLRGLLGIDEKIIATARAVVLDVGARVALVVDAVDSLVTITPDRIEARQAELGAESGERLDGAFQTAADGHATKILNIRSLL